MMRAKTFLIMALLFPILTLMAVTAYKKHLLETGYEVTLPIYGYDPRDLLSGHYVTYTVDYGVEDICRGTHDFQDGYVCLDTKTFSYTPFSYCEHYIIGSCANGRFEAGIERFYIPEDKAPMLDKKIRDKQGSIMITVSPHGKAQVKELLIDGKPWTQE